MITIEKIPWSFIKFSLPILKGNVWRSVWRICMWILGLKGLIQTYETPTVNWIQYLSTRHKVQWLNNTWSFGNSHGEAHRILYRLDPMAPKTHISLLWNVSCPTSPPTRKGQPGRLLGCLAVCWGVGQRDGWHFRLEYLVLLSRIPGRFMCS